MSEKLCALRKIGGGTLKETVLWSNPSPTSAFAGQDATLNESVDNFKQIAVYFKGYKTNNKIYYSFYDKDLFKSFTNVDQNFFGSVAMRAGANTYARMVYYVNNTKVTFGTMYQVGGTYSNNDYLIPTKIVGLK